MSVNIYAAHKVGNTITHADNWDDKSTMNLANANFYSLADELGLSLLIGPPAHIKVKTLAMALQTHHSPRYSDRLKRIIAQAEILKATYIAFS
jgi:hypothetical protein